MSINEVYKKLGLNRKELYGAYNSLNKIVWEQVLLISIYSRQVYATDQANQFHQRLKLIHRLKFVDLKILQPFILELIESGCGSREITSFLLKLIESQDTKNEREELTENLTIVEKLLVKITPKFEREGSSIIIEADRILNYLEDKQIAFSKVINEHPYSYYSMYKVLSDPLSIFSKMLSFDPSEEEFDNIVLRLLNQYIQNLERENPFLNIKKTSSWLPYKFHDTFETLLKYAEDNKLVINSDDLNIYIKSGILEEISYISRHVFSFIQDYNYFENQERTDLLTPIISEISKIYSKDDELSIIFDQNILKDLIHLGQVDSIMGGVKEKILEFLDSPYRNQRNKKNIREANANALRKLELWYKKLDTKFIKKTDQIPKLIASIIEFDIRNKLGFCTFDFGSNVLDPILNYHRTSMQEIYILTTNLIKRCLYEKSGISSYKSTLNGVDIDKFISEYYKLNTSNNKQELDNHPKISLHNNRMMHIWVNEDPSSINDRFKKLPPYLKKNKITFVFNIIEQQRKFKTTNIYPVDSVFPLPLWVKTLKIEF